jgi:hypothetical protein
MSRRPDAAEVAANEMRAARKAKLSPTQSRLSEYVRLMHQALLDNVDASQVRRVRDYIILDMPNVQSTFELIGTATMLVWDHTELRPDMTICMSGSGNAVAPVFATLTFSV